MDQISEKKIQKEDQITRERRIVENIEKRYGMIGKIEKQMLNSILEWPGRSILIEKVIIGTESTFENRDLITDSENVKKEVDKYF